MSKKPIKQHQVFDKIPSKRQEKSETELKVKFILDRYKSRDIQRLIDLKSSPILNKISDHKAEHGEVMLGGGFLSKIGK